MQVKPNVRTYTALVTAMGNAQQWDRALEIVRRMKAQAQWGGCEPNAYTYSALLKTMGEQVIPCLPYAFLVASSHIPPSFIRGSS